MAADPKFYAIADTLRAAIASGEYGPGARLPSEDDLASAYGCAVNTARAAVRLLVAEGLVEVKAKSGSFVRQYDRILRDANQRLAATQWGSGRDIWDVDAAGRRRAVDQLEVYAATAPDDVTQRLSTPDVWVRKRRYLIDERPVQIATAYLPAAIVEGTAIATPDTGPGGTYARLAEVGHAPVEFVERAIARMPSREESQRLGLLPSTPVVHLRREAVTAAGRIVEVNDMVCAGDAYVFQWRFPSS